MTEAEVADRFAAEFHDKLAYRESDEPGVSGWYEFDGSTWRRQRKRAAFSLIHELATRMSIGAKNWRELQSASFARGAESLARVNPALARHSHDWPSR